MKHSPISLPHRTCINCKTVLYIDDL